jgi:hypothetical protein
MRNRQAGLTQKFLRLSPVVFGAISAMDSPRAGAQAVSRLDLPKASAAAPASAAVGVVRDWKLHPAIVVTAMPKDLYALGDIHGDYDRMVELLATAKLIAPNPARPEAVQWTGGPAVLVITGDMIDRYNHSVPVLALLRALQPAAQKAGGLVIVTLGNHEAEFLASGGDEKKKAEFGAELTLAGISPVDVANGRDAAGLGAWMRNLPAGARVGDWFFCHAGNTQGHTIEQIDDEVQSQVSKGGFDVPVLMDPDSMLEARMHPRPWWEWDGAPPTLTDINPSAITPSGTPADIAPALTTPAKKPKKNKAAADATTQPGTDPGQPRLLAGIEALGAKHLVMGHQPGKIDFPNGTSRAAGQMFTEFDGLIFFIDTGMSRGVDGGRGAVLHVQQIDDAGKLKVTAVYADGKTESMLP